MGIKPSRLVALKSRRQDFGFPGCGRRLKTFEHRQCGRQRVRSFEARIVPDMLPGKQKAQEIARCDWLNFRAQSPDRGVMNAGQQPAIAPLLIVDPGIKPSAQDRTFALQCGERSGDSRFVERKRRRKCDLGHRPETFQSTAQNFDQRLLWRPRGLMA
jgi:hypothetical protein